MRRIVVTRASSYNEDKTSLAEILQPLLTVMMTVTAAFAFSTFYGGAAADDI